MSSYTCKAKVWKYPGVGGWHFVRLSEAFSKKIKTIATPYGAGFIKVEAKIGATSWRTALFPQTSSKTYLLSIKASVRKKEDIWDGDEVSVTMTLL